MVTCTYVFRVAVKDTHLHAEVQRMMEQLEVKHFHSARKDDPDRVPKLSYQEIVDIVREAVAIRIWLGTHVCTMSMFMSTTHRLSIDIACHVRVCAHVHVHAHAGRGTRGIA